MFDLPLPLPLLFPPLVGLPVAVLVSALLFTPSLALRLIRCESNVSVGEAIAERLTGVAPVSLYAECVCVCWWRNCQGHGRSCYI